MYASRRSFLMGTAAASVVVACRRACSPPTRRFTITAPMDPPEWALLERELLHAHTAACTQFFQRYFNQADRLAGDHGALGRR